MACRFDEDEAEGEESGEDDAHGGSTFDVSEAADPLGEDGGEHAYDGSSEKHGEAGARASY